ncbi:hypothetical protein PVAP13_8KG230803 [Panicum virgatum]|uniref:Uncharacterized protein n=1 Tax=Panicum virgatum TaxID=38727 RepID=A0A8T0PHW6_PANVG|nr:hypothetical protein PVAP13_8KG230803 [Panicum virgatum]
MCLRLERNEQSFGSVSVFPPTEPMHLISTLSLYAGCTSSKTWRSLSLPQNSTSECPKPTNMHTKQDAASFHYQSFTSNCWSGQDTWVTPSPSQETRLSRSDNELEE